MEELEKISVVRLLQGRSIISLIGNVQRSSLILERVFLSRSLSYIHTYIHINIYHDTSVAMWWQAFNVLRQNGVNVQMISQGASKV